MRKIISNLLIILIIILIIIFLLNIIYSKIILKENLIKIFGNSFVIITTGSMEPEIEGGELVIISDKNKYTIGDIVTYEDSENFLVTHRIINIDEKNFVAKGDANNLDDGEIPVKSIKGKVIYHSKLLGNIVLYFLKPIVIIYVILFIGINLYFYIFNKEKNIKKENVKLVYNENKLKKVEEKEKNEK